MPNSVAQHAASHHGGTVMHCRMYNAQCEPGPCRSHSGKCPGVRAAMLCNTWLYIHSVYNLWSVQVHAGTASLSGSRDATCCCIHLP
jgi:hypothetical protein